MKHTVTAVALLLLGVAPVVSSTEEAELAGMRDDAFAEFQELVEQALVWRVLAVNFLGELKSHDVYTAIDLALIHREGTARYMPIRERLLAHTKTSRWLSDPGVEFEVTTGTTAVSRERSGIWPFRRDRTLVRVNPREETGRRLIRDVKVSLASALVLYDNYVIAISGVNEIAKLRKIVNWDHPEIDRYLEQVTRNAHSQENFARTARAIKIIDRELAWEAREQESLDDANRYLNQLIQGSLVYDTIDGFSRWDFARHDQGRIKHVIEDRVSAIGDLGSRQVSRLFGNAAGLVQWRSGKLRSLSADEKAEISARLEPLDILLEKTPFRLTDKLIPGYWGHVAIWVGTPGQLVELGVWSELPQLYRRAQQLHDYRGLPFQTAVESGHTVIEALRPGVQLNTLDRFLNIDDLTAIRPSDLGPDLRRAYLLTAFAQIGKAYDFNFDVESDRTIVCSELAYVVYGDPRWGWPTDTVLSRATISPDHVAEKAHSVRGRSGGEASFEAVLLYHDGHECTVSQVQRGFDLLIDGRASDLSCK